MTKNIKLNSSIEIDLAKLIDSRLLIQANSGGGKSWAIRRLVEQAYGKSQILILDLEGEFSTLREKYDFILAGKDADTPADLRSATLLAKKLLELNVSAIIDLSEMHAHERKPFARLFLEGLIESRPANKAYNDCLVIIDEAHQFAPEKGQSEAAAAVIDLCTRGRKRSLCAVLATQRISKLAKDAAAECNNKLIGRTGQDIDMKRAYEELGFSTKEQFISLRQLEAGEFFAFGPAISREVIKIKIGEVHTTHKLTKKEKVRITPPTAKIKALLPQLADLAAVAKKEAVTVSTLQQENRKLIQELGLLKRNPKITDTAKKEQVVKIQKIQVPMVGKRTLEKLKISETAMRKMAKAIKDGVIIFESGLEKFSKDLRNIYPSIVKPVEFLNSKYKTVIPKTANIVDAAIKTYGEAAKDTLSPYKAVDTNSIKGGALRMLKVLVSRYPIKLTKAQLATFSKMAPRGGSFGTYMSTLRSAGFINESGDLIEATQAGIDYLGETPNPPQTSEEIISMWLANLSGGSKRMLETLITVYPNEMTKEELGNFCRIVHTGGSFGTYLSILRSNGLIEENNGNIKAHQNLFR